MKKDNTSSLFPSFKKRAGQRGQGLLEYGLILVLVGVASIALIAVFEEELRNVFRDFSGQGEFAPPALEPIGGEFRTRIPSPTPQPQIINFSISPGSLIQIPPSETETDVSFDVEVIGSFNLYEVDVDQNGTFDLSWIPGQTPPIYTMAVGKQTFDLRATASNGEQLIASRFVQVYNDVSQLDDTAPIVEISADVGIGQAPLTVNFTVTRLEFDADSSANTYRWAMGNGYVEAGSGTPTTFSYTYTQAGTFRPILQVTDNEDFSGFSNELVIEVAPPPPNPTETPTPTNTPDPICPYGPYDLPGTVQFQNFACGGPGVSYNDTTTQNIGTAYRTEEVDIYAFDDQGGQYIIGNVVGGEWLKYTVNIATTAEYDILVRVAAVNAFNSFQIYLDGTAVSEPAFVPNTGSYQSFVDIIVPQVTLVQGSNRDLEFRFNGDVNYNFFAVSPTQKSTACTTTFVEAETGTLYGDFVIGTAGAASGGRYIFAPNGAGSHHSFPSDNHRAEYCFNVTQNGTYKIIGWAYGANGSDDSFHYEMDGTVNSFDTWSFPQNTTYQSDYFNTLNGSGPDKELTLTAGVHNLTVYVREDGSRLDKIQLELISTPNTDPTITNPGNQTNNTGDTVNLAISASDADGDTLTYSAVGLPPGLAINSSSGAITGSPTTAGSYAVSVTVNDGNGGTATASFNWTIVSPPVTITLYSNDGQDGWVLENGTTNQGGNVTISGTIQIGDTRNNAGNNNEQRKGFVSFDTSSIPDGATVTSVQLRLRRENVSRDPDLLGTIFVDIASPTGFSNNLALQSTDFQAAAGSSGVATLTFPNNDEDWSIGLLNGTGLVAVNKTGTTQFRIYFSITDDNDNRDDYLEYYSGGAASGSQPEMIITYVP